MSENRALVTQEKTSAVESALIQGDLSKLSELDRLNYYRKVCDSLGLNPFTKPFDYLKLGNKLTLYAKKDCTDQLRKIHKVSVEELAESERDGVFIVTAKVKDKEGRTDVAKGAVNITGLKGEALANAVMKAETKAKRRATLSICGLGFLDESEVESILDAGIAAPSSSTPQLGHKEEPVTNGHAPKQEKPKFSEAMLAEIEGKWVRAHYCQPGFLATEIREWATGQNCDLPISQWPKSLHDTVGDFLRGLLEQVKQPAPKQMLDTIEKLKDQLGMSEEYAADYLAKANLLAAGEIPNEHRAQAVILSLQEELRKQQKETVPPSPSREPGEDDEEYPF